MYIKIYQKTTSSYILIIKLSKKLYYWIELSKMASQMILRSKNLNSTMLAKNYLASPTTIGAIGSLKMVGVAETVSKM